MLGQEDHGAAARKKGEGTPPPAHSFPVLRRHRRGPHGLPSFRINDSDPGRGGHHALFRPPLSDRWVRPEEIRGRFFKGASPAVEMRSSMGLNSTLGNSQGGGLHGNHLERRSPQARWSRPSQRETGSEPPLLLSQSRARLPWETGAQELGPEREVVI